MHVRVFRLTKSATQSGSARSSSWLVEPEYGSARKPAPPMGWISAQDPFSSLQGVLSFPTQKAALAFAKAQGWTWTIKNPHEHNKTPHNYLHKFKVCRSIDEEKGVYLGNSKP
ncbi:MAG: ETC complex I subunit [Alphaproteobacteria bacterium]|nr:ETC complex I subunit [Alphaproteobacteria bacterium]